MFYMYVYGLGHAEMVLGKALAGRREGVLIGSKCGLVWNEQGNITNDLTPENLYREIDESLRRLNVEFIDIYQMHWPDPTTPIEASMEALMRIKEAGKIRHIGVSNFSVVLTEAAMAAGEVISNQGLYNMLERNPDSYHNIPLDYRTEDIARKRSRIWRNPGMSPPDDGLFWVEIHGPWMSAPV